MIGIIDYGLGNIRAFANVYKRLDIPCKIIKTKEDFQAVTKLILPGVGAFDEAITSLKDSGLLEMVESLVFQLKMPILGICIGMQLLADSSDEGNLPGLGWIPGEVKKFNDSDDFPLPHMGWNDLTINKSNKLLKNLDDNCRFYFLHSYYFEPFDSENILGKTQYAHEFISIVNNKNIYGIQFHPEKSHSNGLKILENFWKM